MDPCPSTYKPVPVREISETARTANHNFAMIERAFDQLRMCIAGKVNQLQAGIVNPGLVTVINTPGTPGQDGQDGEDGATGAPGKRGVDGLAGFDGGIGNDGLDGAPGVDGEDGEDAPIIPGPRGRTGSQGTQGEGGAQGATGATGVTGATGATGATGSSAADSISLPFVYKGTPPDEVYVWLAPATADRGADSTVQEFVATITTTALRWTALCSVSGGTIEVSITRNGSEIGTPQSQAGAVTDAFMSSVETTTLTAESDTFGVRIRVTSGSPTINLRLTLYLN